MEMHFSNHNTDISKTDLVQMTFIPKDNVKPSFQKPLSHRVTKVFSWGS